MVVISNHFDDDWSHASVGDVHNLGKTGADAMPNVRSGAAPHEETEYFAISEEKDRWLHQEELELACAQHGAMLRTAAAAAAKRMAAEACTFVRISIASERLERQEATRHTAAAAVRAAKQQRTDVKRELRCAETETLRNKRLAQSLAKKSIRDGIKVAGLE